jgi:hypothetical protein
MQPTICGFCVEAFQPKAAGAEAGGFWTSILLNRNRGFEKSQPSVDFSPVRPPEWPRVELFKGPNPTNQRPCIQGLKMSI